MAAIIDLEVQQPYFDAIVSGTKTIEGRLAKAKYLYLKQGDHIRFSNPAGTRSLTKTIVAVCRHATFKDAFKEHDYHKAIPGAKSTEDAINVYEQFYPRRLQDEIGVVFIELQ